MANVKLSLQKSQIIGICILSVCFDILADFFSCSEFNGCRGRSSCCSCPTSSAHTRPSGPLPIRPFEPFPDHQAPASPDFQVCSGSARYAKLTFSIIFCVLPPLLVLRCYCSCCSCCLWFLFMVYFCFHFFYFLVSYPSPDQTRPDQTSPCTRPSAIPPCK